MPRVWNIFVYIIRRTSKKTSISAFLLCTDVSLKWNRLPSSLIPLFEKTVPPCNWKFISPSYAWQEEDVIYIVFCFIHCPFRFLNLYNLTCSFAGSDPTSQLIRFAREIRGTALHLDMISLGRGQGPRAEEAITKAYHQKGKWVFLQNCHHAASFMPHLQKIVRRWEKITYFANGNDFRRNKLSDEKNGSQNKNQVETFSIVNMQITTILSIFYQGRLKNSVRQTNLSISLSPSWCTSFEISWGSIED